MIAGVRICYLPYGRLTVRGEIMLNHNHIVLLGVLYRQPEKRVQSFIIWAKLAMDLYPQIWDRFTFYGNLKRSMATIPWKWVIRVYSRGKGTVWTMTRFGEEIVLGLHPIWIHGRGRFENFNELRGIEPSIR